jgi:O-antigen/teichoic acid export membrane protein
MGIVSRQTIKGSIYSYLGAFIGFVNVALLMPRLFATDQIGLVNILVALSTIFGQLGTLGMVNVTIRQFPYFRGEKNNHNGFLFFALAVGSLGFVLYTIFYYLTKGYVIRTNIDQSPLFAEYVYLLLPFVFITIFYFIIDTYNRLLFNASFGAFAKELLLRLLNFITIVLFWLELIDFHQFIILYTISYAVPVILICILLICKKQFSLKPSFKLFTKSFTKEVISVAVFGLISSFSGMAVLQIDRYLINHYCDLSATGIYSTVFFFGTIILLPGRSLIRISSTLITEAIQKENWKDVNEIYKRSTTSMSVVGMALFVLIWGNINNIMTILPPEFGIGRYVIFFIALAHLLQMIASVSSEIIYSSKYYREFAVLMIILIISIIIFNIILLPKWGIVGASIALALAFLIYLVSRQFFIYWKFKLNPYKLKHIIILIAGLVALIINVFIPQMHFILDICVRSLVLVIVFFVPVLLTKVYPELNSSMKNIVYKLKKLSQKSAK